MSTANSRERTPAELIQLSLEIENRIDPSGDLQPIPGKDSALFTISRYKSGYVKFFRYDIPSGIRRQIEVLDPEVALGDLGAVRLILAQHTSCDSAFAGKGYYFTHPFCRDEFPDVVLEDGCYAILVDGEAASRAWTADESEQAAELAVETAAAHRRRGYARQVVAAWAGDVLARGKVAFYSHEVGNTASEALAHSLGVVQYAVVTTYGSNA
jgi:GNAT superfamily N-acetyltransferase